MSNDVILKSLKTFNWQKVINMVPSLVSLNDEQWRFAKGYIIEIATEMISNNELRYVGEAHKDFNWSSKNLTVELKSATSGTFYKKNGKIRKTFSFKFTNSNGTNTKNILTEDFICDIVLFIKEDGVAFVDKKTVIENLEKTGDGFVLKLKSSDIVEVTGKLNVTTKIKFDFKEFIKDAIQIKLRDLFQIF